MPVFPILMLAFLTIPIAEIYVLITVGAMVGVGTTIALVVATAVIGAALMRREGLATLGRMQREMNQGGLPAEALIEGVMLLFAGALLLTPGFLTDAVGFIFLFRPTRLALARWFVSRSMVRMKRAGGMGAGGFSASFGSTNFGTGTGFSGGQHAPDGRSSAQSPESATRGPSAGQPRSPAKNPAKGIIEGEFSRDDH